MAHKAQKLELGQTLDFPAPRTPHPTEDSMIAGFIYLLAATARQKSDPLLLAFMICFFIYVIIIMTRRR